MGLCRKIENLAVQGLFGEKCVSINVHLYLKASCYLHAAFSLCLQELCLIRFHPATEEEEVAYVSLFSYFSSRKRFGVVANNNRRIKDLYLIPLGSKDPLPPKLLPFDGPGKHLKGYLCGDINGIVFTLMFFCFFFFVHVVSIFTVTFK